LFDKKPDIISLVTLYGFAEPGY